MKNTFQLIQEAVPFLEETQGNITCVASIAGFQPSHMIGAYSVSKTAMIGKWSIYTENRRFLRIAGGPIVFRLYCIVYTVLSNKANKHFDPLKGLVKALSFELAHRDIRINSVCPGIVRTKFAGAITETDDQAEQFAMQRYGEPREISGVISFLSDNERASYITGEAYNVCGGGNFRL